MRKGVTRTKKMNKDKQRKNMNKKHTKFQIKGKQSYVVVEFDLCKKTKNARTLYMCQEMGQIIRT